MPTTVSCVVCGEQTYLVRTRLCDFCYDLDRRIRQNPYAADRIIKNIKKEKEVKEQDP